MRHQLATPGIRCLWTSMATTEKALCNAGQKAQHTFGLSFSNSIVLIFSAGLAVCGRTVVRAPGMTKAWAQPRVTRAKAQAVFMIQWRGKRSTRRLRDHSSSVGESKARGGAVV